jgi:two-component system OmpR family response regulator
MRKTVSANATTRVLLSGSLTAVDELAHALRQLEYAVEIHTRVENAIQAWSRGHCEAALLSISEAQRQPFSVIRAFREQRPHSPILAVSSLTQLEERVAALDAGADDYIIEPVAVSELQARLSAILRNRAASSPAEIRLGPVILRAGDPGALIGTTRVELTPSERALLEMFALASGNIVAKSAIAQRLGEEGQSVSKTAVEVVVYRLRRRLVPLGLSINTLRGVGYRLRLADAAVKLTEQQSLPPPAASNQEPREADVPLAEVPLEEEPKWWNTRLLEYTNDAIIIWEMQGRGILYWNRAAEQLYGYSRDVAQGRTTHELLKTQLAGGVTQLESSLAKYGVWIGELTHTTSSGRRVQVEGRLALMSQQNERWLVLEVNRDITDRKALELSRHVMERQLEDLHALRG